MGRINSGENTYFYKRPCKRCDKDFRPTGVVHYGKWSRVCMKCKTKAGNNALKVRNKRVYSSYLDRYI